MGFNVFYALEEENLKWKRKKKTKSNWRWDFRI